METSTSAYEHASFLFSSYDETTRMTLDRILRSFQYSAEFSLDFQFYVAILGAIMTILHFFVLTRKGMMTSSVISVLIGMASFDFVAMLVTVVTSYNKNIFFAREGTDCVPPTTKFALQISWIALVFCDFVRRSSVWLAIMMAMIRFLVLKYPLNPRFHNISLPSFGFKTVFWCFLFSCPFSSFFFFRYDILELGSWSPQSYCENAHLNLTLPVFDQRPSAVFTAYNGFFGKAYMFSNGTVTKIIPCILLPLLTILLVIELRKADKVRKTASFTQRSSSEKTTGLVLFMAVSFFTLEIPMGLVYLVQVKHTDLGFIWWGVFVYHICNAILTLNVIIHCVICFLLSSQYKKTVKDLLGIHTKSSTVTSQNVQTIIVSDNN